jgi:hypothetical protein
MNMKSVKLAVVAIATLASVTSLATGGTVGSAGGTVGSAGKFKGIVCEAEKKINGIKPMVLISNISKTAATLSLDMNGTLPDIRNAQMQQIQENGKLLVAYGSEPSAFNPSLPNFAIFTDGSTAQDTTRANLVLENQDDEIKMNCKDGMAD